jgi:hypothetical protein
LGENLDLNSKIDFLVSNVENFLIIAFGSFGNMQIMHYVRIAMAGNVSMNQPAKKKFSPPPPFFLSVVKKEC